MSLKLIRWSFFWILAGKEEDCELFCLLYRSMIPRIERPSSALHPTFLFRLSLFFFFFGSKYFFCRTCSLVYKGCCCFDCSYLFRYILGQYLQYLHFTQVRVHNTVDNGHDACSEIATGNCLHWVGCDITCVNEPCVLREVTDDVDGEYHVEIKKCIRFLNCLPEILPSVFMFYARSLGNMRRALHSKGVMARSWCPTSDVWRHSWVDSKS